MFLTPAWKQTPNFAMEGQIFDESGGLLPDSLKDCFSSPGTGVACNLCRRVTATGHPLMAAATGCGGKTDLRAVFAPCLTG